MERKSAIRQRRDLNYIRQTILFDFILMLVFFVCLVQAPWFWMTPITTIIILVLIWRAGTWAHRFTYCLNDDYRDDTERQEDFRDEALAEELIFDDRIARRRFFFDLNIGTFAGSPEPDKVWRLIELARKHAYSSGHGEHVALLKLVALKTDLDNERVEWLSPTYAGSIREHPERWISLQQWLEEGGRFVSQLFQN